MLGKSCERYKDQLCGFVAWEYRTDETDEAIRDLLEM